MWTDYYFSPHHDPFYSLFSSPWQIQYEQEAQRRRHRREQEYRREMLRRAQEEEQRLLELQKKQKQKGRYRQHANYTTNGTLNPPSYQIIQGLDGQWYRVPIRRNHRRRESHVATGPDRRWYQNEADTFDDHNDEVFDGAMSDSSPEESLSIETSPKTGNEQQHTTRKFATHKSQTTKNSKEKEYSKDTKKARNVVIVEDASDSEKEDEILDSVWRNRRPSPGEWMEPVTM